MAKKRTMPEIVFIGPPHRREKHKQVVFRIVSKSEDGIPTVLRLMGENEKIQISGGEEFMTGYLPYHMTLSEPEKMGDK